MPRALIRRNLIRLTLSLILVTVRAPQPTEPAVTVLPERAPAPGPNEFSCRRIDIAALASAWKAFTAAPLWSIFSINTTDPEDPWAARYPHLNASRA